MNLLAFLKEVDTAAANLSKEQLEAFIHETARILPEANREDFLKLLSDFEHMNENEKLENLRDNGYSELVSDIENVCRKLDEINSGKRCLGSEYNEAWDDWYNSDDDEILFADPKHLLEDIENAIDLIHRAVDMEAYAEGCKLAENLSVLEVSAEGDYNDYDGSSLGICELYDHDLLNGSFETLTTECLFLVYMGNDLQSRAEEMFRMIENFQCHKITLEAVLQTGNQNLPQFNEFLLLWIDYLGRQSGFGVKKLLDEVQSMITDEDQLLDIARRFTDQHPELYRQILQRGLEDGDNDKMLNVGREALERISESYTIRSEIALLAAEYACRMEDDAAAESCWKEAFRSDTSVTNYMRLRFLSRKWEDYAEEIRDIYETTYKHMAERANIPVRCFDFDAQEQNSLNKSQYCTLLFFDQEFERVRKIGMNEKKALGWSSTFMKEGLAAFMLLLFEGETLPKGLSRMCGNLQWKCRFSAERYFEGTGRSVNESDETLFWNLFAAWKKDITISEKVKSQWLLQIEKLISHRVAGIMEANRRNYYGECAAFIAAFGEVQESLGLQNAKEIFMQKYKKEYPRRRAFHQELRNYGMIR